MIFKDERIGFCVNTYLNTTLTNKLLNEILIKLPKEAFNAINNYKSYSVTINGKKYSISFNKCCSGKAYESLVIKMQEGRETHVFKIFYTYFNADILSATELSRSFINYEKYITKGIFSAPQRVLSFYSSLAPQKDFLVINCIEDNNGKISKFSASLRKDYLNFTNLKSSKYYFDLDKWIFNNTSATK